MSGGPDDGVDLPGLQLTDHDRSILDWTQWHWGRVLYRDDWPFG